MNRLKEQINYSKFVETKSVILDLDYAERLLLELEKYHEEREEANEHIHLRQLIETGDIFSPQEFYDEYESCLKGDGSAVFIMKDLSVNEDFETCWSILENCVDKYDIFDRYKCQIAFIIWFNR